MVLSSLQDRPYKGQTGIPEVKNPRLGLTLSAQGRQASSHENKDCILGPDICKRRWLALKSTLASLEVSTSSTFGCNRYH